MPFTKELTEGTVFPIFRFFSNDGREKGASRVLFISDSHYGAPFGCVGGHACDGRHVLMIDAILKRKDEIDCVIFNGDMACRNGQLCYEIHYPFYKAPRKDWLRTAKEDYFDRLTDAGVPYFAVHASHDSLRGNEFYELFGHENHYALLFGDTAYLCFDLYQGERSREIAMQTARTDISAELLHAAEALLGRSDVKRAIIVSHYPYTDLPHFYRLAQNEKVIAFVAGHSHYNDVETFGGKPMLQCGHFSRANMRLKTLGLDFKPFVPLSPDSVPTTTAETGKPHKDYSATGSPWQYRMIEAAADGSIESYTVYPEMTYYLFEAEGCRAEGFCQPYVEARPSFLGSDAPIDKSYWMREEKQI